jgi:hypothetical protein
MDDDLRETLQRKADDVRPRRGVPPSLGRRAGRRIALNSLLFGTTAVVVVAGAIVGFRAFTGPPAVGPGHSPSPTQHASSPAPGATTASGTPTPAGAPACTSGELRANGSLQGAAGSREGVIDVANFSDTTCTLQGRPDVTLLASPGHEITSGITFMDAGPGWMVDGDPQPAGWPVVTLQAGDSASVRVRWGNWCPQGRAAPLWQIDIPGDGPLPVTNGMDEPPPCNGEGVPSTIEVGPFEPHRAG